MELLRTYSGSRLYGNHHDKSDYDVYSIITNQGNSQRKRRASQKTVGNQDVVEMDLSTFMQLCTDGAHQALEVMFAPDDAVMVDEIREFRHNFRASIPVVRDKWYRTAKEMHLGRSSTQKRRFHALRIMRNFELLVQGDGKFSSRMNVEDIELFTRLSQDENWDEYLEFFYSLQVSSFS